MTMMEKKQRSGGRYELKPRKNEKKTSAGKKGRKEE